MSTAARSSTDSFTAPVAMACGGTARAPRARKDTLIMAEPTGTGGTGAGPTKMGVYDQPERPTASPTAKLLPILIALAILGALAYYFLLRPRGAEQPATSTAPAATRSNTGAGAGTMNDAVGPRGAATGSAGTGAGGASSAVGGGTTSNPPGPGGGANR